GVLRPDPGRSADLTRAVFLLYGFLRPIFGGLADIPHPPPSVLSLVSRPAGAETPEILQMDDVIRVILADDHTVVRTGLKAVLSAAKDIQVIGEAKNGLEAVALAERFSPDVVV